MGNVHFEKVSFKRFLRACRRSDSACGMRVAKEELVREVYDLIQLPRRATSGSAGYDFYVPYPCSFSPCISTFIPTGIRVCLEPNQFLMCVPRSGLGFKYGMRLKNSTGIIDAKR